MKIIQFEERYRQDFIDFNTDWIVSNFGFLEKHDIETFEKIDDELRKGAMIFFAVENGTVLAACMAMPMNETTWEICKLASNKNVPHKGAGSTVFKASMDWASTAHSGCLYFPTVSSSRRFTFTKNSALKRLNWITMSMSEAILRLSIKFEGGLI